MIASRSAERVATTPSAIAPAAFLIGVEFTSSRFGTLSSQFCTFWEAFASRRRGPMIGRLLSWSTVFGISLLNVRIWLIVGTVTSASVVIAIAPVTASTSAAAYLRCQPVRRRSASTTGVSATAISVAIAVSVSVRGIERTSQIVTASTANAIAIGIAECTSMSTRSTVASVPATGALASAAGSASSSDGPSPSSVTSISYER